MFRGRRVVVKDLLDEGLIAADASLTWACLQKDVSHRAKVLDTGDIRLDDGRIYSYPSRATCEAAGIAAADGWRVWKTPSGRTLFDLRSELLAQHYPSG